MKDQSAGLPARVYVPFVFIFALVFLGTLWYLLRIGFGATGSVLGPSAQSQQSAGATGIQQAGNTGVGGGPPPAVASRLGSLRAQIASHPDDDVALTQLGDLYLTAGKYAQAIPYYQRALRANRQNQAAQAGLDEARAGAAQAP